MTWTLTNLLIQLATGILGAHGAAVAAQEHRFGFLGHTLTGAVAGALSGYFLQGLAVTVVTGAGSLNSVTSAENAILQGLAGLASGGCAMLVIGLVVHGIREHGAR